MAKIIELIITTDTRGTGNSDNPYRTVTQLFTKDGNLIAEDDKFYFKGKKLKDASWFHSENIYSK